MHQHFHQTASGQNLVSGLTFAITTHNQIDQTKATSPQCRLQALALVNVCLTVCGCGHVCVCTRAYVC